jgi:integrase
MSIKKHHQSDCAGGDCKCKWLLDYRPQGVKGQRVRLEFDTKRAAELHQSSTRIKVSRGEYRAPSKVPTFKVAADLWYESKTDRRPSHVGDLRSRLDKHILPHIGEMRMDHISVAAIEKLRDELRAATYAARTINAIIRIISAVFESAIRRDDVARNPVDRVERSFMAARELKPGVERESDDDAISPDAILSPDEIRLMLKHATPGLYQTLFTTAALTGARAGELFALRWNDVELPKEGNSQIQINKTVSWARLKGQEMRPRYFPPKTRAGTRSVPISAELAAALRVWKLKCAPTPDGLVFPAADGRPLRRSNVLRYGLWAALDRAKLRRVNIHSLRHSFASALIMGGAAVSEVQSLLGHASPAITLRIYTHWFKKVDSGAVGRLSQIIMGDSGSARKWTENGQKEGGVADEKSISA